MPIVGQTSTISTLDTDCVGPALQILRLPLPGGLALALLLRWLQKAAMLRISVIEGRRQRRLIVEGKLIGPWAAELKTACDESKADLRDRELVVEMKQVTAISQEGENVLLELMSNGIKVSCRGVFTKQVLKQLCRRATTSVLDTKP